MYEDKTQNKIVEEAEMGLIDLSTFKVFNKDEDTGQLYIVLNERHLVHIVNMVVNDASVVVMVNDTEDLWMGAFKTVVKVEDEDGSTSHHVLHFSEGF